MLTFYIYAPWATVRRERYFAVHTTLAGRGANYHARPRQLVVGSLFAFALVLYLTFGDLLGPTPALIVFLASLLLVLLFTAWAAARSRHFRDAMTGWRGRGREYAVPGSFWPILSTSSTSRSSRYWSVNAMQRAVSTTCWRSTSGSDSDSERSRHRAPTLVHARLDLLQ